MVKKDDFTYSEIETGKTFPAGISTHVDWKPRTNIIEAGDMLVIEVELPGVNKDDVSIQLVDGNQVILRGSKPQPRMETPRVTYHLFEREFGSFYKKIVIDFPLDADKINSVMENGVLTIKLPKKKIEKISVDIK